MTTYQEKAELIKLWVVQAIQSDIGVYHWSNGLKTSAISIIGNQQNQHPPAGVNAEGLEVVIFYPEPDTEPLMGYYLNYDYWVVLLKQWDSKKSTLDIKDKLQRKAIYPISQQVKIEGNAALGIPEMFRLTLQLPQFIKSVL